MELLIKVHPICYLGCLSFLPLLIENEVNHGVWEVVEL